MLNKSIRSHLLIRIALGLALFTLIGIPVCFAGGALTIVKDEKQFAPRGSYIPERRVERILKKVEKHKAAVRQKDATQQENRLQESETPAPQSPKQR